jgi:N-acyl-D-aspartate/D-glutamate deacylase
MSQYAGETGRIAYGSAMMESVGDIPREAILLGLPWDWETYGEYLDSTERHKPTINIAALVGHGAATAVMANA